MRATDPPQASTTRPHVAAVLRKDDAVKHNGHIRRHAVFSDNTRNDNMPIVRMTNRPACAALTRGISQLVMSWIVRSTQ